MTAKEWINSSKDFATGVHIYNAVKGANAWQRKYKNIKRPHTLASNLLYELRKIAKAEDLTQLKHHQQQVSNTVKLMPTKTAENVAEQQMYLQLPDALKTKWIEKGKLFSEALKLRKFLWSNDEKVRSDAALQIVDKMKRNRELWEEIDFYITNKTIKPTDKDVVALNPDNLSMAELVKLKTNLAPWLSKEKGKIDKEQNEEKKKLRIEKYNAQLAVFNRVKELLQ